MMRTAALLMIVLAGCSGGRGPSARTASAAPTGKRTPTPGWEGFVSGAVFSPDSSKLLTGYDIRRVDMNEKRLILWDAGSGKQLWATTGHENLRPVAFLPDATGVLAGDRHSVQLRNAENGEPVRVVAEDAAGITNARLSFDGRSLLTGNAEGGLKLWDVAAGKLLHEFGSTGAPVGPIAFAPDGTQALVSFIDSAESAIAFQLWNVKEPRLLRSFRVNDGWSGGVAFSPDGTLMLAGRFTKDKDNPKSARDYLALCRLDTFEIVKQFEIKYITLAAFTPDGKHLVLAGPDKTVALLEIETGKETGAVMQLADVRYIALSPDAQFAFVCSGAFDRNGSSMELTLWSLTEHRRLRRLIDFPRTLDHRDEVGGTRR